jgi:membrane-bound lytic murein transglycosylase D
VERRNLPGELAMLPVVESAYQPFAYSPARASGIWQFIPSTGRVYGLRYSWWYDGRRDVVESTRAALDYLEKLHAEFSGDWLLALAAYNSGEGNVRKAINRNLRAGKPTDFWSLKLPRETRSYVPRLLAISAIVSEPAEYGLTLKSIPDEPYFAATTLDGQIDLALAAEMAEVSLEELYLLNPGFSRWATDPEGPHRLLLPVDAVNEFESRLAELPADERVRWHRHVISTGDTLGTIAHKYRTSVTALKQANNLRGTTIRAGHSLIVPVASRQLSDYRLSADMRRSMRRGVPGSGTKIIYRVRTGDNLWVISKRFGVTVNKLVRWNGLSKHSVLRPGKRLIIWRGKVAPEATLS